MRGPLYLTLSAGLFAALAAPAPAEACSCIQPGFDFIAPIDGATGVPRNTRIWFGDPQMQRDVQITRVGGAQIRGSLTEIGAFDSNVAVFSPQSLLEAGATYEVQTAGGVSRFTVADRMDEQAPAVPIIEDREHRAGNGLGGIFGGEGSSCGSTEDRMLILDIDSEGALTVVDLDRTSNLEPADPSGGVSTFGFTDPVYIGQGGCTFNWQQEGRVGVRLGAFDLAGNFSGWSEDSDEDVPIAGYGCTATAPARSERPPRGALALLGLLGLRRRRR